MAIKHRVKSWNKRLRVSSSIAKLISNTLGAAYYFQLLLKQETTIVEDLTELLASVSTLI